MAENDKLLPNPGNPSREALLNDSKYEESPPDSPENNGQN